MHYSKKKIFKIGVIILGIILVGAVISFLWPKKTIAPNDSNAAAGKPDPAPAELSKFQGVFKAWFEGWDILTYEFSYSPDTFSFISKPEDNPMIIQDKRTGTQTTVKISYEGGRGFSPSDYWNTILEPGCPDCIGIIKKIGGISANVYTDQKNEWVIFPATNAPFLFIAHITLPQNGVEALLSTFRVVDFKSQQPGPQP